MAIREASPLGHHSTLPAGGRVPWVCQESGPPEPPKPRLLDRVRHAIETRHYGRRTEKAYVHWIKRYIFVFFMMFGVSFLSSASPLIGRFLVQSAFARSALVIAVVLFGFAIGGAYSSQMTPRRVVYIAAGMAPLHQLLLLRYLYGRFVERNGRNPQFVTRSSPQADKTFVFTNMMLGAFPYLVLSFIFAMIFGKPGH